MRITGMLGYNMQRAICKNDRLIIVLERVACCYRIANYTRSLNPHFQYGARILKMFRDR